jgi:hypothetical protein
MKSYLMLTMAAVAWSIVFVWAMAHGRTTQTFVDFVKEAASRCET